MRFNFRNKFNKLLIIRNEKINQVYIINRDKGILHYLNTDTIKLINSIVFIYDLQDGIVMNENTIILNKSNLNLMNLEAFKEIKTLNVHKKF